MSNAVDLLVIGAHPDDAELVAGGTLARAHSDGYRTGILDLTAGETGTRGSSDTRAREATAAAAVLGVSVRLNAGLPDAGLHNDDASRKTVVEVLRQLRPRVVIIPYHAGRHPDHRAAARLSRDACFLSGLTNYDAAGEKHRPLKVLYAIAYSEDAVKPTFVVDTSEVFEQKLEAVRCYGSQFDGVVQAGELFPNGSGFYDLVRTQDARYGTLIRAAYGEPFFTRETMKVTDVLQLDVSTF